MTPAAAGLLAAKESAPVKDISGYLLWTAVLVVCIAGVYLLMWRAWKKRGSRQEETLPPLAALPGQPAEEQLRAVGMYHGSTTAGDWLDRTVARGLGTRGRADLVLTEAGVEFRRAGAESFLVPADALRGARTDRGIAGKVVPSGGMLVITWEHGGRELDSGFRSDHPDEHAAWVEAITARTSPAPITKGTPAA